MSQEKYHCFLSFLSLVNGITVDKKTRETVAKIQVLLSEMGASCFYPFSKLDSMDAIVMTGIESSNVFVVFLTQKYMDEVDDLSSHLRSEFQYGISEKTLKKTLIVALEPEMLNIANRKGLVKFKLTSFPMIDMTSDERIRNNIQFLFDEIMQRCD